MWTPRPYGAQISPVDKNGEYYGIPFKQEMWCVYYNKDIFDAAGVPYPSGSWTWDEYVATAKKLTDKTKGIYGSFMQSDTQYMYLPACQKKVPFYKADGTCNFDDPEFSKAISWYKNLSASDGIQMSVSDLNVENASWNYYALAGDHLAMFMQGNWFVRLLNSQRTILATGNTASPNCPVRVGETPIWYPRDTFPSTRMRRIQRKR